jgi:membrane protease YdiL (CAAX protease family)
MMGSLTETLKRHALIAGVGLMFLFTWPIDLAHSGVLPLDVPFPVYLFLGWGFVAASVLMTALTLGASGVALLLKRFLIWRVGWRWFAVAALLYPAIFSGAVLINAAVAHTPIEFSGVFAHRIFGADAFLPLFVVPFFFVDAISNGEEIGWRGYVLPRLQVRHGALAASLIVGVIWGLWHLPKFLAPGNTTPFWLFMIKTMTDAVLYTWLFNNTRGSLLLTTILHAAGNTAGVFLPIANTAGGDNLMTLEIQVAIQIGIAVLVTAIAGTQNLSRTAAKQVST